MTIMVSRNAIALWRITETSKASGKGSAWAVAEVVRLCEFQDVFVRVLMPAPLIQYVNRIIVFHRQNHGFEDVHVPAISNPQANDVRGFRD
jgi:hypothetical protein